MLFKFFCMQHRSNSVKLPWLPNEGSEAFVELEATRLAPGLEGLDWQCTNLQSGNTCPYPASLRTQTQNISKSKVSSILFKSSFNFQSVVNFSNCTTGKKI